MLAPLFSFAQTQDSTSKKILWSENVLKFIDFPVVGNDEKKSDAYTSSSINYKYKLRGDSLFLRIEHSFNPEKSWVRKKALKNTYLLKHEQGHFDITEAYARLFVDRFLKYRFTSYYKMEIKKLFEQTLQEAKEVHLLYDKQTNGSNLKDAQAQWNKEILNMMKKLQPINGREFFVTLTTE